MTTSKSNPSSAPTTSRCFSQNRDRKGADGSMRHLLYLSLGSNLGDREENLAAALARLPPAVRILRVSPLYETAPLEFTDQPSFLNQVIEAETDLAPDDLLRHTAAI